MKKKPNIIMLAVDSLASGHMELYGYHRQTMPYITRMAAEGAVFRCFSPSVPTSPGYSSILTGKDCFGTGVVTLKDVEPLPEDARTLQETLKGAGYDTVCVGFGDGPYTKGFDKYLSYSAWGKGSEGKCQKAHNL
ncbi:MAG TPA: sulfatase, partial [Clostridiales bacterium]|nr:sulfatase [Clostridiales bacterium]